MSGEMAKKASISFLMVLFLVTALIYFLFCTNAGLRVGLGLIQTFSEKSVKVGPVSGTLCQGFTLKRISVKTNDYMLNLENLSLRPAFFTLLKKRVVIDARIEKTKLILSDKKTKGDRNKTTNIKFPDLPIDIGLKRLFIKKLDIVSGGKEKTAINISHLDVVASLAKKNLTIERIFGIFSRQQLSFNLKGRLWQKKGIRTRLDLSLYVEKFNAKNPSIKINTFIKGDTYHMHILSKAQGDVSGNLKGMVHDLFINPTYNFFFCINGLDPHILFKRLPTGKVFLKGKIAGERDKVDVVAKGALSFKKIRVRSFRLRAGLSRDVLSVREANLRLLEGNVTAKGTYRLSTKGFKSQIHVRAIHLEKIWPRLKGSVNGTLKAKGALGGIKGKRWATVTLTGVEAGTEKRKIALNGIFRLKGKRLLFEKVFLNGRATTGKLSGWVEKTAQNVSFSLKSEDLTDFHPFLKGNVFLKGRITGPRKDPGVNLALDGKDIYCKESRLSDIKIRVDSSGIFHSRIRGDVKLRGLNYSHLAIYDSSASFFGKLSRHQIKAQVTFKNGKIQIGATCGLKEGARYAGQIERLTIKQKGLGSWKLSKKANIELFQKGIIIAPLRLVERENNGLFLLKLINRESFKEIETEGRHIPVEPFLFFTDAGFSIKGRANFSLRLSEKGKRKTRGHAYLSIKDARILPKGYSKGEKMNLLVTCRLSPKGLFGKIKGDIPEKADISGNISFPGYRFATFMGNNQPLDMKVKVESRDLRWLHEFSSDIFIYKGSFDGEARITGSFKRPVLMAKARLKGLKAEYPRYGIPILTRQFFLEVEDKTMKLSGTLQSETGPIFVKGHGSLDKRNFAIFLSVTGKNYRAVTMPHMRINISPDLAISLDRRLLRLGGKLLIPYARIKRIEVSKGAILPSPDIKLIGKKVTAKRSQPVPLELGLRVEIGKDVIIDAYGLKGKVQGRLDLTRGNGGRLYGTGVLKIKDGVYSALGTTVSIKKGRLSYFSSPIDDPVVDIEAVRKVSDVTVGFRVSGTLNKPIVELFSDPAMPESEIARYLLGGRKGRGVSTSDIVAGGANLLLSKLRERLGLVDQIKVETGQASDDVSLVVGTYLRPDVYLKFINDFNDKVTRVMLRYDYSRHIEIETETGERPSVDIYLKMER